MNKKFIIIIMVLVIVAAILLLINTMRKPSGQPLDQKMQNLTKSSQTENSGISPEEAKKTIDQLNKAVNKSDSSATTAPPPSK